MSQKPFMWNGNNPVEYSDPAGYDPFKTFDDFLTNAMNKLERALAPGGPRGNRSGGLSSQNISRMGRDLREGAPLRHLPKFQNSLRSLRNQFDDSYEAEESPGQGTQIRNRLRSEYNQGVQSAEQEGYSFSQVTNNGELPSSLPSEQQSLTNQSLGERPSGSAPFSSVSGEEEPAEPDVPPKPY